MRRITVKKGGIWHFTTMFRSGNKSLLVKNVADEGLVKSYGLNYVLAVVYKSHDEEIRNYETSNSY